MVRSGILVLSAAVAFAAAVPAAAHETIQITASTLNVRSGPGTGYPVIGMISAGQVYVRISTSGPWEKIWYAQTTGWVYGSYTTTVSVAKASAEANVNVRMGPGADYAVVGTAPEGSWWAVIGSSGSWKQIYYKGAVRWVYGTYLASDSTPSPATAGGSGLPTSSAGFVQLPASGPGFYAYSSGDRRWGTPACVYGLMNAAKSWNEQHPSWPRLGVGDISLKYGGTMSGHASHKVGKDVDIRPVASTGYEGPLTTGSGNYSSSRTKDWITQHVKVKMNVNVIFFNDPAIYNSLSYVQYWPNHYNHMHVRVY